MAVLFLLLAFLLLVGVAAAGIENTDPSTASLFDRSFGQLTEGQLAFREQENLMVLPGVALPPRHERDSCREQTSNE